jgi:chromosome partitioning protein
MPCHASWKTHALSPQGSAGGDGHAAACIGKRGRRACDQIPQRLADSSLSACTLLTPLLRRRPRLFRSFYRIPAKLACIRFLPEEASMIVAIVNQHGNADRSIVARNLAVLRARSGRKVCLAMTGLWHGGYLWGEARSAARIRPWLDVRSLGTRAVGDRLAGLRRLFNDIVVDAGARDTEECRRVLGAARVIVVPARGGEVDLVGQYTLARRLNAARALNPEVRILFVAVCAAGDAEPDNEAALLAHVHRVGTARLAPVRLHEPGAYAYGEGRCVCDAETCGPELADEMHALYREVYAQPVARPRRPLLGVAQPGLAG